MSIQRIYKSSKLFQNFEIFLPIVFMLLLTTFVLKFSTYNANNDVYLQLLSVEGLIKGKGYGFYQDGEFISITSRPAHTRWPPGLTVLACIVALMKLDPLVVLVRTYPFLIVTSYLILFYSLKNFIDIRTASIISFAALTPLCVFEWYRELASEPFAFLLSIILFNLVISGQKSKNIDYFRLFFLILVSIVLTMIRTAGTYFIPIVFLLYALFWLQRWSDRIKFISVGIFLSVLPILVFHIMSEGKFTPVSSTRCVSFITELNNNIGLWSEVIIPRITRILRYKGINITIGWIILMMIILCIKLSLGMLSKNTTIVEKGLLRTLVTGFGFGITYTLFLSISSVVYSYPWSEVYRVNGFSLPWIIISFSSCVILLAIKYKRTIVRVMIGAILLLSIIRYGYAYKYMTIYTTFQKDYRVIVEDIKNVIYFNFGNIDRVYIYEGGHWKGRNLLRMLWYFDRYYKKLPWRVIGISKHKFPIYIPKRSILIIVKEDIKSIKTFISSLSLRKRYKDISHLGIVIFNFE